MEIDFAISEVDGRNASLPPAVGNRTPLEPQSVRGSIKKVGADWKFPVNEFECGRSGSFTGAVIVSIRLETVVEKSVLVVLSVTLGERTKNHGTNKGEIKQALKPAGPVPRLSSLD